MTTPGGVPNLPLGALTVETLNQQLQDLSAATVRRRAGERMPAVFHNSTGGNILNDLSPFGILTRIWAEINALIAASSPNDINGPEDLPPLITDFIEGLPVIGQLFDLLLALLGQYEGDDDTLNQIQDLFAPVRALVEAFGQLVDGELTNLVGFFDGFNVYDPVNSTTRLLDQILEYVIDRILTTLTGNGGGIDELTANIPLLSDIVQTLTGSDSTQATDLGALGAWARGVLTQGSQLPAENIFGTISSAALGIIPVGNIGNVNPNLLTIGTFEDAANFVAEDGWTWDDNVNQSGGTGSAKLTLNGTVRQLTSAQDVPVSPGDKLNLSVWIKTASYSGSGTPLAIQIVPFIGSTQQSAVTVASTGANTSWTKISGQYTVATTGSTATQITSLRVQLAAAATATSGTVWWDDVVLSKVGLLQQSLVDSLLDAWNNIWRGAFGIPSGTAVTGKTVVDLIVALANPLNTANNVGTNLSTLDSTLKSTPENILGTLASGITGVLMDGVKTIGQFLGGLFDAFGGTTGATTKNVTQLFGIAPYPLTRANLGITNASTAQSAATQAQNGVNTLVGNLVGGWTIETILSNQTWTNPGNISLMWVVCFGGGAKGSDGAVSGVGGAGLAGGIAGDYIAQQINPASIPSSVTCTIGLGSTTSKTTTSFGSLLSSAQATTGYVASPLGYFATQSFPAAGGAGGAASTTAGNNAGSSGSNSFAATGGGAGAGAVGNTTGTLNAITGSAGGAGGAGATGGSAYVGGAGGGGGGGARNTSTLASAVAIGATGGAGGFPGGGGGGGGNAFSSAGTNTPGSGGAGGNGAIYLIYQKAAAV